MALFDNLQEPLSLAVLHSIWQGAALVLAWRIVLALLGSERAEARYWAAFGALMLQFGLFVATFFWATAQQGPAPSSPAIPTQALWLPELQAISTTPANWLVAQWQVATYAAVAVAKENSPAIAGFWLAGVALLGFRFSMGLWLVGKLRASAVPASELWQHRLRQMAEEMGIRRMVALAASAKVKVPTLIGWLRPLVLMPIGMLVQIPPAEIDAILAHELAHLKRNDYLMNLLQSVAEMALFFHPATWWLSAAIHAEREYCCDDAALRIVPQKDLYIKALAGLAIHQSANPTALAATGQKGSILTRIHRIMKPKNQLEKPAKAILADKIHRFNGKSTAAALLLCFTFVAIVGSSYTSPISQPTAEDSLSPGSGIAEILPAQEATTALPADHPAGPAPSVASTQAEPVLLASDTIKSPVFFLDGKPISPQAFEEIDPATIAAVEVLKGPEAVKKYGQEATSGAIAITLRRDEQGNVVRQPESEVTKMAKFEEDKLKIYVFGEVAQSISKDRADGAAIDTALAGRKIEKIVFRATSDNFTATDSSGGKQINVWRSAEKPSSDGKTGLGWDYSQENQPLFVVDKVRLEKKVLLNDILDPTDIKAIDVLKGEKALEAYGEDGRYGVISITTKGKKKIAKLIEEAETATEGGIIIMFKEHFQENTTGSEGEEISEEQTGTDENQPQLSKNPLDVVVFPNPAADVFNLAVTLPTPGLVRITVVDVNGKLVSHVADDQLTEGTHAFKWDAHGQASGMYLIKIENGSETLLKKVIVE